MNAGTLSSEPSVLVVVNAVPVTPSVSALAVSAPLPRVRLFCSASVGLSVTPAASLIERFSIRPAAAAVHVPLPLIVDGLVPFIVSVEPAVAVLIVPLLVTLPATFTLNALKFIVPAVTVRSPPVVIIPFMIPVPDCDGLFQITFPKAPLRPVGFVATTLVILSVDVAFHVAVGTAPPFML